MTQLLRFLTPLAALALAACSATAPIVDQSHPASAAAAESPQRPFPRMLDADEPTRRTRELIASREAHARGAESEPVGDQTNIAPQTPEPAGHEHHR